MAPATSQNRRWIDIGVSLGRNPGRTLWRHFKSNFHLNCVKKQKMIDEASMKGKESKLIVMLKDMSMTSEEKTISQNIGFVKIVLLSVNFIIQKEFPNSSLESIIDLIGKCGSEQVKKYLLTGPRNATYTSTYMFTRYLQVLNDFVEIPLLESLRSSQFYTLFFDETTDLQTHSQAATFAMFEHKHEISEHFIGLINMTASFEGLTALDFFKAIDSLSQNKQFDLTKNAFSETDGAPVNEGDAKGLKTYFVALNPHHVHEKCNSHNLALTFKHKITNSVKYGCIEATDRLAVSLHVYFKDSSLRVLVFEQCQITLLIKVLQTICPSSTRWLSHDRCFCRIVERYFPLVTALATIWETRGDAAAYGLLLQLINPETVLTCLLLCDVLRVIKSLVLWLQSNPSSVDVSQLQAKVEIVVSKLKALTQTPAEKVKVFSTKELGDLVFSEAKFDHIMAEIASVSINQLQRIMLRSSTTVTFSHFKKTVHDTFIVDIANEIEDKIKPSPISAAFRCFDVNKIPEDQKEAEAHGLEDLSVLGQFYGNAKSSRHPSTNVRIQSGQIVDRIPLTTEFEIYKRMGISFKEKHNKEINNQITHLKKKLAQTLRTKPNLKQVNTLESEISDLQGKINNISLREIYSHLVLMEGTKTLIPNILTLLKLAILCPIGNAVVERLFSLMALIKTNLRTSLLDVTLERLLRVKREGPKELSEEDLTTLVDMFRKLLKSENKSNTTRLNF